MKTGGSADVVGTGSGAGIGAVRVGVRDGVVGVAGRGGAVVRVLSGGATMVSSLEELLTITSASTSPDTRRTSAPPANHGQRGGFGG